MDNIKGKKILLMINKFYNYDEKIAEELRRQGAIVYMVSNHWPKESFRYSTNFLRTLFFRLKNPFFKRKFTNETIRQIQGMSFDVLLAIGGFPAKKKLIKYLKRINNKLETRIFFWDSFHYWKIQNLINWFDVSFSFDPKDCKDYPKLRYLPDFYLGQHKQIVNSYKYDISHIGSSHIFAYNRIPILSDFKTACVKDKLNTYFMVYESKTIKSLQFKLLAMTSIQWFKYYRVLKKFRKSDIIRTRLLDYQKVVEIESQSRCIVDIPPSYQAGMTIRALEAIASGKKLITTNKYIQNEPFYNESNIYIIDEDNPIVDPKFIISPVKSIDISYLRLDNWLKTVLS